MVAGLAVVAAFAATGGAVRADDTTEKTKAEPIVTDRPDFTESTDTVPAGKMQLEGGFTYSRAASEKDSALGELLLRVAAGRRAEVRIGLNSYDWTSGSGPATHGMEDATLGMKLRLAPASQKLDLLRPNMSVILMTTIPSGSPDYRDNHLVPTAKLAFGWELSKLWEAAANVNYTYASDQGTRFDQVATSLSFGYSVSDRVGAYFEAFGLGPQTAHGADQNYVNAGVTYLVNNDYQLDFRGGCGISGTRPDYFFGVGAARRW
jgi:hypothetical protein